MDGIIIRKGRKEDLNQVLYLIKELAEYEKAPQEVTITIEELERDGFGEHPLYWLWVAEHDKKVIGISLWYLRFSTWKGRCLYLEDIIVTEKYRGKGIGKKLFERTIMDAKEINAKLMTWQVLDWNLPAIKFYQKYNAELDDEWINGKLRYDDIQAFKPTSDI